MSLCNGKRSTLCNSATKNTTPPPPPPSVAMQKKLSVPTHYQYIGVRAVVTFVLIGKNA